MSRNSENYNQSVRKVRKEISTTYGLDEGDPSFKEGFGEFVKKATEDRLSKYNKRLFERHDLPFLQDVFDWSQSHYSPVEFEKKNFEGIMMEYIGSHPGVPLKNIEKFFDKKSGEIRLIEDPFETELRWPDVEAAQRGEVKESEPATKSRPGGPEMPESLKGMSSDKIKDLIDKANKAGVKEI